MALLSEEQVYAAPDLVPEELPVPEWPDSAGAPGMVRLRGATSEELEDYDHSLYRSKIVDGETKLEENVHNAKARLVVVCCIDEQGGRMFKRADAAEQLGRKAAAAVNRIFQRIMQLSGRSKESIKAIEGN